MNRCQLFVLVVDQLTLFLGFFDGVVDRLPVDNYSLDHLRSGSLVEVGMDRTLGPIGETCMTGPAGSAENVVAASSSGSSVAAAKCTLPGFAMNIACPER